MRPLVFLCSLAVVIPAAIIDRVAILIDQQAITESQIDEEMRVTAFLNAQPVLKSLEQRRAAADRLIQQALVEREMKLGHYPAVKELEVQHYLEGVAKSLGSDSRFAASLEAARLTPKALKAHLALQLTSLRFIEYRFRPNFDISDQDFQVYAKQHGGLSSDAAREQLRQQRTDDILSSWLEESRKQVNIVYMDPALQ